MLYPNGQTNAPIPHLDKARRDFMRTIIAQDEFAVSASYFFNERNFRRTVFSILDGGEAPLEVGAESWLKPLLPFKKDRVLKRGDLVEMPDVGNGFANDDDDKEEEVPPTTEVLRLEDYIENPGDSIPLLATTPYAIVRVEALGHEPWRLDEWVHRLAKEVGLEDIWKEDELSLAIGELYDECGVDIETYVADHDVYV
jgi:hypothetical protein